MDIVEVPCWLLSPWFNVQNNKASITDSVAHYKKGELKITMQWQKFMYVKLASH